MKTNKQGGKRDGAGRPTGTGKYGCETVALRVPKSKKDSILRMIDEPVADFEKTCESRGKRIEELELQVEELKEANAKMKIKGLGI